MNLGSSRTFLKTIPHPFVQKLSYCKRARTYGKLCLFTIFQSNLVVWPLQHLLPMAPDFV